MTLLSLENIYAGYQKTDILQNITMQVAEGEFCCIIGPNGCGKTTLLKVISGALPYRGKVSIHGESIRSMKPREMAARVALLSQLGQIYYPYTVYDTVLQGRYRYMRGVFKTASAKDHQAVEQCLQTTGLWSIKDRMIDTLSGGQLQRVFLARTLVQEPSLILLDEPTNHLDLQVQVELMESLQAWRVDNRCAVVGVLHDINLTLLYADSVLLMQEGQQVAHGSAQAILTQKRLQSVFGLDVVGYMKRSLAQWEHLS